MHAVQGQHLLRTGARVHQAGVVPGLRKQRQYAQDVPGDGGVIGVDVLADVQPALIAGFAAALGQQLAQLAVAAAGDDDLRLGGVGGIVQDLRQGALLILPLMVDQLHHGVQGLFLLVHHPAEALAGLVLHLAQALPAQGLLQGVPPFIRPLGAQLLVQLLQKAQLDIRAGVPREDAEDAVAAAEAHQARRLRGGEVPFLQAALEALAEALVVLHIYSSFHLSQNLVYSIIGHMAHFVKSPV